MLTRGGYFYLTLSENLGRLFQIFIYLWLHWVIIAAHGLSVVVVQRFLVVASHLFKHRV